MRRAWRLFAVGGVVVLVVVVLLVIFLTGGEDGDTDLTSGDLGPGATEVTSPYDFLELPNEAEPGDVQNASYVSILLVDEGGQVTSYGLNADMPEAQALRAAVYEAEQVGSDALSSLTTAPKATSGAGTELASTLTFVFPDRTTLTFDLFVEHGLIARAGRVWQVEGDLPLLVEAAASAGPQ